MIHHINVVVTPRRVTVIPSVPEHRARPAGTRLAAAILSVVILLVLTAFSLPAQAPAAAAARPDSGKAAAPARAINWTSDRHTFQVGDIIQVMVDEYALASASKDNASSASRRRQMDLGISPPSMPGGTSAIGDINATVGTGDAGSSQQRGNARNDTRYVGQVAVRVVAITKEGLLQVKGSKTIDADKNKALLTVAGFVRPIDVGPRDAIRSEAIADAQISYSAKGSLGKTKNGIVSKLLGLFWP